MSDLKADTRLAKVVHITVAGSDGPLEVVINRGARDGVKRGDRFLVFSIGPHVNDPDTGEDLGEIELVRGRGEVVHVQEQMATIRTTKRRRTRPGERIIRDPLAYVMAGRPLSKAYEVIEEELAPEAEMPFDAVTLGDFAKPI